MLLRAPAKSRKGYCSRSTTARRLAMMEAAGGGLQSHTCCKLTRLSASISSTIWPKPCEQAPKTRQAWTTANTYIPISKRFTGSSLQRPTVEAAMSPSSKPKSTARRTTYRMEEKISKIGRPSVVQMITQPEWSVSEITAKGGCR